MNTRYSIYTVPYNKCSERLVSSFSPKVIATTAYVLACSISDQLRDTYKMKDFPRANRKLLRDVHSWRSRAIALSLGVPMQRGSKRDLEKDVFEQTSKRPIERE
jgi:hypothetical protein